MIRQRRRRQEAVIISVTWSSSKTFCGLMWVQRAVKTFVYSSSSLSRTKSAAVKRPDFMEFLAERDLPSAVRGPVELFLSSVMRCRSFRAYVRHGTGGDRYRISVS